MRRFFRNFALLAFLPGMLGLATVPFTATEAAAQVGQPASTGTVDEPFGLRANAGNDQTVPEGTIVTLDGSVEPTDVAGSTGGDQTQTPLGDVAPPVTEFVIRDWSVSNPDYAFRHRISADPGIVEPVLGADRKPVYASDTRTVTTTGADAFEAWYNDVDGVNERFDRTFQLELVDDDTTTPIYRFDDTGFLPLGPDEGFGAEGQGANFNFTTEYLSLIHI